MPQTDLAPILKVSARLLDLHDSGRASGSSTQYQNEERAGLGDGRYVAIAGVVLTTLQDAGKRTGNEYSTIDAVCQSARIEIPWASDQDIEYVLNVLSRPTELRLLHQEEDEFHVIGDKETNLVEKAAHLNEFRLSKIGQKAIAVATENTDIVFIEGDVTKLLRALEAGKLKAALNFVDQVIEVLRTSQIALISVLERASSGRRVVSEIVDQLQTYELTMRRTSDLIDKAQIQVESLIRGGKVLDDDIPLGLVKEKVRELSRGVVGYARSLSLLASKTLTTSSSSVEPQSFAKLALRYAIESPRHNQVDFILHAMGPIFAGSILPIATDFQGTIKPKIQREVQAIQVDLGDFQIPLEDQFIEWLAKNQRLLNDMVEKDGISLQDAVFHGLEIAGLQENFGCFVAAMTSPDEWMTNTEVLGSLSPNLVISHAETRSMMFSGLTLKKQSASDDVKVPNDTF